MQASTANSGFVLNSIVVHCEEIQIKFYLDKIWGKIKVQTLLLFILPRFHPKYSQFSHINLKRVHSLHPGLNSKINCHLNAAIIQHKISWKLTTIYRVSVRTGPTSAWAPVLKYPCHLSENKIRVNNAWNQYKEVKLKQNFAHFSQKNT